MNVFVLPWVVLVGTVVGAGNSKVVMNGIQFWQSLRDPSCHGSPSISPVQIDERLDM